MKSIEIQNLDQHLRPLQVDGVSTGLELSTGSLRISGGSIEIKNLTSETAKVDGDLTVDGNIDMTGSSSTKINMYGDIFMEATSTNDYLTIGAKNILINTVGLGDNSDSKLLLASSTDYDSQISFMEGPSVWWSIGNDGSSDSPKKLSFSNGATLGTNEEMSITSFGLLTVAGDIVAGDDIAVAATGKFSFDGIDGHTYIYEKSDDELIFVVGTDTMLGLTAGTSSINKADFKTTAVGMTQGFVIYNATDTTVYFSRAGNKQFLTFGSGNITDMNLTFPDMSGNFVLLVKQDGTGSRTVTNWKTFDQDSANESYVRWAGGSAPTLTTTASKTDILSFYWDNTNHIAYGVATLNF